MGENGSVLSGAERWTGVTVRLFNYGSHCVSTRRAMAYSSSFIVGRLFRGFYHYCIIPDSLLDMLRSYYFYSSHIES